jgi:ribosomal-protein-alanine N-acetyltransferase
LNKKAQSNELRRKFIYCEGVTMVKNMRLETNRLIIRAYTEDDFMESYQLMQDKELFKYKDMDVMSLDEFRNLFDFIIGMNDVGFDGDYKYSFIINLKETGENIGWVGIGGMDIDHSIKEIYYLISRKHQGKGYATEASSEILKFGFNTININEIVAVCDPENIPSKRVMEKIGLKFRYIQDFNGYPFYSLTKNEYLRNE